MRARTRPRRARPSLKFSLAHLGLPQQSRAKSAFFPGLSPLPDRRNPGTPSPSIAACHKFINLEETRALADSRSVGKKASAAAAGSTSAVARGDAIRVKAFRQEGSWHGGNAADSLLKVAGLFRSKSEQNIQTIIKQHSAKGAPCSITATLDSIDGGFTPAQLENGDLGVKLKCGAVDSTGPAPVPSMSRIPSHLANTTSREGSEGSSGPTPPPRARRGKEKQRSNLTRALPADDPLDSPRIQSALFPRSAVECPTFPEEPRGHLDVTVKMVGTMDEHPAYWSEKERTLSLEHARRLGRYLAERTIEGTLDEAEQTYGKTSQMWKEAGSVVEERDEVPRDFPPREEHQLPYIQVCIRGNPDADFDAVGGGCDDEIRRLCTDGVVGVPAEDQGDIHGSGRSTEVVEPPPSQTYFRDAMDDLDFLSSDVLLDASLRECERDAVVNAALNLDVTDVSRVRSTFSPERGA